VRLNPLNSFKFYKQNFRWLFAGALLTYSSSFGQTYFISIFAGEIRAEFDLSHGGWGTVYMVGTLCSALAMVFAGSLMDNFRARTLGTVLLVAIAVTAVLMSVNIYLIGLVGIIFLLRFLGQGMLAHVPKVAMSRWFQATRGRALAVSSMGFVIGEATLPLLFVTISSLLGWRDTWLVIAALALLFIPVIFQLLKTERTPKSEVQENTSVGMLGKQWTRMDAIKHPLFWLVLPTWLAIPAFATAFFFHQVHFTEVKGWELINFVALFPIYASVSLFSLVMSGFIIDRFKSDFLVPLLTLPFAASFFIFSYADTLFVAAIAFVFFALMAGFSSTVSSTFWAEFYGTEHLGSIKSFAASIMVFASAIGPWLTGVLIDQGITLDRQLPLIAIYFLICSLLSTIGIIKARRRATG
jgi:MFS family permease